MSIAGLHAKSVEWTGEHTVKITYDWTDADQLLDWSLTGTSTLTRDSENYTATIVNTATVTIAAMRWSEPLAVSKITAYARVRTTRRQIDFYTNLSSATWAGATDPNPGIYVLYRNSNLVLGAANGTLQDYHYNQGDWSPVVDEWQTFTLTFASALVTTQSTHDNHTINLEGTYSPSTSGYVALGSTDDHEGNSTEWGTLVIEGTTTETQPEEENTGTSSPSTVALTSSASVIQTLSATSAVGLIAATSLALATTGATILCTSAVTLAAPTSSATATQTLSATSATALQSPTAASTGTTNEELLIDHTSVAGFTALTSGRIAAAAAITLMLRRASVGGGILDALNALETGNAELDCGNWNFEGRGNPGWALKLTDFATECAAQHAAYTVLSMKFCFIDSAADPDDYVATMEAQEAAYPDNTFVWWTMPIEASADLAASSSFNAAIRLYCQQNSKILYDIADIESHYANGSAATYNGYECLCPDYDSGDHGHPNSTGYDRLAKAFWMLVDGIASGPADDESVTGTSSVSTVALTVASSGSQTLSATSGPSLAAKSIATSASQELGASGSSGLVALSVVTAATQELGATSAPSLAACSVTSAASQELSGTSSPALAAPTVATSVEASNAVDCTSAVQLAAPTCASSAYQQLSGVGSSSVSALLSESVATQTNSATSAVELMALEVGLVEIPPYFAVIEATLATPGNLTATLAMP
jgi:hypothetical protein